MLGALVVLAAWPGTAAADQEAQLEASVEVVGAPTPELLAKPLEVDLKAGEEQEPGQLRLPIVARQAGRLQVEFLDLESGEKVPIGEAREDSEKLEIAGQVPEAPLAAGQLYLLQLVFTPPEAASEELEGVLEVGIAGGRPIARTVVPLTRKKGWIPAQKKVEIVSTNPLPSLFFDSAPDRSRTIGVAPEEAGEEAPEEPFAERYVAFGNSGNATVTVGAPETVEDPATKEKSQRSKISVRDVSGIGTATTVVDLGGAAKPSQEVEIVVQVSDSFWIPLLVIIIGAFLGKLLPTWWDSRREGKLVGVDLRKAIDEYQAARAPDPDDDGPPDGLKSLDDRLSDFEQLHQALEHVNSAGTLEKSSTAAQEAIDQLRGWLAVHKALRDLAKAAERTEPVLALVIPTRARPYLDSLEILERTFESSPDLSRSERWAKEISLQAEALEQYAAIYGAARGGDDESERLVRSALSVYLAPGPPLARSSEAGTLMVEGLRQIHGWLRPAPAEPDRGFVEIAYAEMPEGISLGSAIEFATRAIHLLRPESARSAEDVMAEVRHGDWAVFTVVLVVSAIAYLLPVYATGPFGTPLQYLAAFVAGAGAQVVVSGVAAPIARSMKSGGDEEKKDDPAAAPAAA